MFVEKQIMRYLVLLLAVSLQMSSCITVKKQNNLINLSNNDLTLALQGNKSPQQKMDILGSTLSVLMTQSLKFKNPVKGSKYVQKFSQKNGKLVNKLLSDVEQNLNTMDPMSQLNMGMSLMKKPYFKDMIKLLPEFEKKFNQIAFVSNLVSKVKGPLKFLNLGSNGGGININDILKEEE